MSWVPFLYKSLSKNKPVNLIQLLIKTLFFKIQKS